MPYLKVQLSAQPAAAQWGKQALVSFDADMATIHLQTNESPQDSLRRLQKAARQLDGLNTEGFDLVGQWQAEQQWHFAYSVSGAKKQFHVNWCDNADRLMLENRYRALMFTRNLVNNTPEDLSPQVLAQSAANWIKELGGETVSTRQWVGEELQAAGWTGVYNVGRGSSRPPVMLEVDVNPTGDENAPVAAALVGKGITFDSGGYSIKSSEGMLDMKCDMGGAATVTGALGLAMMQGLSKRVKLFLCCAENLISGHAYKLGDILTYKNGLTVEIVNTDAEGRLVLADGLIAASETGAPLIINAATLTGAALVAMGNDYNALFGLDSEMQQKMMQYAQQENELHWPLPLASWHQDKCPSHFADTANSRPQKGGGAGGASNAAGFLSRFVPDDGKGWVHMDLAAAYNGNPTPLLPAGASAQGFRTIARALLEA